MNLKNNELKEYIVFLLVVSLTILAFAFALFGITGVRVVLGLVIISIPFYFMLNNFELNYGEKFVFSALLGLTLFSSLAYILGLLMSFRIAIAAAFIVLIGIAFALTKFKKRFS